MLEGTEFLEAVCAGGRRAVLKSSAHCLDCPAREPQSLGQLTWITDLPLAPSGAALRDRTGTPQPVPFRPFQHITLGPRPRLKST